MTDGDHTDGDRSTATAVTYGSYLALDELLSLQRPRATVGGAEHPDELLFIVVHQASELWFKVILHELDALVAAFEDRSAERALWHLGRLNGLMRIVSGQLTALDTLPPQRFMQFRTYLGTSSGSQSVQFRAIEAASGLRDEHFLAALREHGEIPPLVARMLDRPTLQELFLALLRSSAVTPEELYLGPGPSTLFFLAEGLMEYEQQFARWRFQHVQLVERIIGPGTGGTGGTLGARYLAQTVSQKFFPVLWEVRSRMYGAASAR
ncbi:tryptophan 23-dioxygenase [Gemmatirosa kalamazoonensis]|uniref:Tryptophan 23-dioxygenase n=1 Tax=Gemmatirosa kalamazoonensis TaxID=861299 RepID=W0RJ22_9BACT|nr:tryptophan 2,3-dioxygenase family protein [Gemmatirosa kalamazoonensis]AHG90432.1 tryptophan 23-dioxygenase [Gemmatirosa kalamazoonensis]